MSPTNKKSHGKAKKATAALPSETDTTSPLGAPSVAPVTRVAFREFVELANLESIKLFLATAASTPEGRNLECLWDRAFEEGRNSGQRALLQTFDKKLDAADDHGYKRGFEEGQSSKIKIFATGLEEGRADECSEWIAAGHGQHCFPPTRVFEDSSIQTKPEPIPTTSVCTQTDTSNLQSESEHTTIATHPLAIEPISGIPSAQLPPPMSFNWADDAETLPILSSHPPRDLSVLCSSSPRPFSSLQRRNKRSQAHFSQPFHNHTPFSTPRQTFSHRRFPPPRFSSTPFRPFQYPHRRHHTPRFSSTAALNWEDDPRLLELSRALNALGWVQR